jgi:hypothetical protein
MLEFDLDETVGIVSLKPHGSLRKDDIAALGDVVDRYIDKTGVLQGLLIDTIHFPFWESFDAFKAHMAFIEEHHMKVARVAVVCKSPVYALLPMLADFFLQSEVERYSTSEEAMSWLTS